MNDTLEKTTWNDGEYVSFRLIGGYFGTGFVQYQNGDRVLVKLDCECKDFEDGDEIFVHRTEIIVD